MGSYTSLCEYSHVCVHVCVVDTAMPEVSLICAYVHGVVCVQCIPYLLG